MKEQLRQIILSNRNPNFETIIAIDDYNLEKILNEMMEVISDNC